MPFLSERAARAVIKALTEGEIALDAAATAAIHNRRPATAKSYARASDKLVMAREIIEAAIADERPNDRKSQNHVPGGCQ